VNKLKLKVALLCFQAFNTLIDTLLILTVCVLKLMHPEMACIHHEGNNSVCIQLSNERPRWQTLRLGDERKHPYGAALGAKKNARS